MGLRKPIRKIRKGVRLGKPANRIRVFSGGREVVRSAAIYMERTHEMAKRQGNKCAICCLSFAIVGNPTFDHEEGRGMGGSRRDDRIEVDGKRKNAALCWKCNGLKGSVRYHWINGQYVPRKEAA